MTRAERMRQKARVAGAQKRDHTDDKGSCTPSSPSRPTSSLSTASSTATTPALTAAVSRRPRTSPRKPRPASIAGIPLSGHTEKVSHPERKPSKGRTPVDENKHSAEKSPQRRPSADHKQPTPHKRSISKPAEKTPTKPAEKPTKTQAPKTPDKAKPKTEKPKEKVGSAGKPKADIPKSNSRGSLPDVISSPAAVSVSQETVAAADIQHSSSGDLTTSPPAITHTPADTPDQAPVPNDTESSVAADTEVVATTVPTTECSSEPAAESSSPPPAVVVVDTPTEVEPEHKDSSPSRSPERTVSPPGEKVEKKKSAAEEAKERLAEKRRQAREEARLKEELQRQKEEEERLAEEERERQEEEEQRLFEEEQLKMMAEARKAEEERLQKAIAEQKQLEIEEEERKQAEEEARLEKVKEEEKQKEEAEKARIANEERLQKEEEDRIARKKRVEAIMSRTRGAKSNKTSPAEETAPSTPNIPSIMTQSTPAPTTNGLDSMHAPASDVEPMNTTSDSEKSSPEQAPTSPTCDPVKPDLLGDICINTDSTVNNSDVEKMHNQQNLQNNVFTKTTSGNDLLSNLSINSQFTNGKLDDHEQTNLNNVNLLDSPISEQPVSSVHSKQSALESVLDCEQLIDTDDNQNQSHFSPDPIVAFTESPRQNAPPSIDLLS